MMKIDSRLFKLPYYLGRGILYYLPQEVYCPFPTVVNFLVTRRCNSKCIMCSIWKTGNIHEELSLDEISNIFSHTVFKNLEYISLAGGEPFLRKDIVDIAETVQSCCPKLSGIGIFTNGFLPTLIEKKVEEMLERLDTSRLNQFLVSLSVDGIGTLHDEIRGVKNGFEKVRTTLNILKDLQKHYDFFIQINTVIQKANLNVLYDIWKFAQESEIPLHFTPVRLANFIFSNIDGKDSIQISEEQIDSLKKFIFDTYLHKDDSPTRFFWEDYFMILQGKKRRTPCLWSTSAVALNADGTLFPCEASETLIYGNVRDSNLGDIWFSKESIQKRRELRTSFCKSCTLECGSDGALYKEFFKYVGYLMKKKTFGIFRRKNGV